MNGLLQRDAFIPAPISEAPEGSNKLGSRFALAIKNRRADHELFKARLIAQGHLDNDKDALLKYAPAVMRCNVRMMLSMAAIFGYPIWARDVKQAYLQSGSKMPCGAHVIRLLALILILEKPPYGLPDAGAYWWQTCSKFSSKNWA